MDAKTKAMLGAGIGLGVLFIVLQVVGTILTGTPNAEWVTGINQASTAVGIAFIVLIFGYVLSLTDEHF